MSIEDEKARIDAMLERLVDTAASQEITAHLLQSSARLKSLSEEMWGAVQSVIDGCRK